MVKGACAGLLTGTLMVGVLVAIFLAIVSIVSSGAKAQAQVVTGDPVLAAAGDIASCTAQNDEKTAALLGTMPADTTVAALGDNAYPNGSALDYQNCYTPSWGAYKAQTRPTAGNHEYDTAGASGYFGYFGAAAGDPTKGYYSYELGTWHVVVLNSNCSQVGGCTATSPQLQWLKADLAAHPNACTLAYWHHPRFSSGKHGSTAAMAAVWQTLYDAGAEIVLSGHDHVYERFAPQDSSGVADPARGIRQFVVGTGGKNHYAFANPSGIANSEVRNADTFGVLELMLGRGIYHWRFLSSSGTFTDSGSGTCH